MMPKGLQSWQRKAIRLAWQHSRMEQNIRFNGSFGFGS